MCGLKVFWELRLVCSRCRVWCIGMYRVRVVVVGFRFLVVCWNSGWLSCLCRWVRVLFIVGWL